MPFTYKLLDKADAVAMFPEGAVPEKLLAASEPKVIALTHNVPLSSVQQTFLDGFQSATFYRDKLADYGRASKPKPDNRRISGKDAELAVSQGQEGTTHFYVGRTGVLNALKVNGLIDLTFAADNYSYDTHMKELTQSFAAQGESASTPPAKKGQGRA